MEEDWGENFQTDEQQADMHDIAHLYNWKILMSSLEDCRDMRHDKFQDPLSPNQELPFDEFIFRHLRVCGWTKTLGDLMNEKHNLRQDKDEDEVPTKTTGKETEILRRSLINIIITQPYITKHASCMPAKI